MFLSSNTFFFLLNIVDTQDVVSWQGNNGCVLPCILIFYFTYVFVVYESQSGPMAEENVSLVQLILCVVAVPDLVFRFPDSPGPL